MPSAIAIDKLTNQQNGVYAQLDLSGTPQGPLTFWVSRQANVSTAVQTTYAGSGPYIVAVPHPDLWYFWAHDNQGFSIDTDEAGGSLHAACLVQASNDPTVKGIGHYLQALLDLNRRGMEAVLQQQYPNETLKQIQVGFGGNILSYPSILIVKPRWAWRWYAFPYVKLWTYTFNIGFLVVHATEESALEIAVLCTEAGSIILNNPAYNRFVLPDKTPIFNVMAATGETDEYQIDETHYAATGSLVWSGMKLLQDTGS